MMNYSDVESKVREATNDDAWGPHGTLMGEIAKYTFTYEHYPEAMSMLWKRMFESKKAWRRTYKVSREEGANGCCTGSTCETSFYSPCFCCTTFSATALSAWFKARGNMFMI